MPFVLTAFSGIGWTTSQCSTILPFFIMACSFLRQRSRWGEPLPHSSEGMPPCRAILARPKFGTLASCKLPEAERLSWSATASGRT